MAKLPQKTNSLISQEPTTLAKIVNFIQNNLPHFTSSEDFEENYTNSSYKNEPQLNYSLVMYLNRLKDENITCGTEGNQDVRSKADILFHFGSKLFFIVEGKILPTPPSNERTIHEYVHGNGAGIQRFKDGKHGRDFNKNLFYENGMIGYIKKEDFEYWFEKVNQWISEAGWQDSEKLTPKYPNQNNKYISNHTRTDKSLLKLHHFWVKVA